ncbi:hypothetical protein QFW77_17015 [Luteimonas sp. RD2P54]|uniref:DUF1440 domain-containing protein n=1 Tax=Luteimonas endophytica TaxID=3042023 RepID=A0ABT6JD45_9GAMM|nr:hypothetical protein [Luteimonas endophytica]MDH5824674.1 hypothetical protein [Luteimonas endophytica]
MATLQPALAFRRLRHGPLLLGGAVAGLLDLIWACSLWAFAGATPKLILQAIGSGWVGREAAVAGGWATALLGLLSHFGITIAMAYVYAGAARLLPALLRRPVAYGALYGIVAWAAMVHVVVPLSAAPANQSPPWAWALWANIAVHMFAVGVPCALAARAALAAREPY